MRDRSEESRFPAYKPINPIHWTVLAQWGSWTIDVLAYRQRIEWEPHSLDSGLQPMTVWCVTESDGVTDAYNRLTSQFKRKHGLKLRRKCSRRKQLLSNP